jgi:SNW domain-containing protein 1
LYVAERNAREEVTTRAQIQTKVRQREKEKKEDQLRRLAEDARLHRGGAGAPSRDAP